jgi:type IV pilus assembly protein PilX
MSRPTSSSSAGFSLVTVLMLIIVLGFLAMGAMNSSIVQERMAGNAGDRNVAFQAAEAALKDGEAAVLKLTSADNPALDCSSGKGFCLPPATVGAKPDSRPVWQIVDLSSSAATRAYGSAASAPVLPEVAAAPRYVIEQLDALPPEPGDSAEATAEPVARAYRVTARAVGTQANTSVVLQSTFVRR